MRSSIALKLAVAFGLVVVLSAINGWVGTNGITTLVRTYEDGALRLAETARLSEEVEKYTILQANALSSYLVTGDNAHRADFDAAIQGAAEVAAELRSTMRTDYARGFDRYGDGAPGGIRVHGAADHQWLHCAGVARI